MKDTYRKSGDMCAKGLQCLEDIEVLKARLDMMEKLTGKTEQELNRRLEGMNEFRSALKDQNSTFLTRLEYDSKHALLEQKIEVVQKLVYIGLGIAIVIEIALRFIK